MSEKPFGTHIVLKNGTLSFLVKSEILSATRNKYNAKIKLWPRDNNQKNEAVIEITDIESADIRRLSVELTQLADIFEEREEAGKHAFGVI